MLKKKIKIFWILLNHWYFIYFQLIHFLLFFCLFKKYNRDYLQFPLYWTFFIHFRVKGHHHKNDKNMSTFHAVELFEIPSYDPWKLFDFCIYIYINLSNWITWILLIYICQLLFTQSSKTEWFLSCCFYETVRYFLSEIIFLPT